MFDSIDTGGMLNGRGKRAKGTRPVTEITVMGVGLPRGGCANLMGAFVVDDENRAAREIVETVRVRHDEQPRTETDEQKRRSRGAVRTGGRPAPHDLSSLSAGRATVKLSSNEPLRIVGLKIEGLLKREDCAIVLANLASSIDNIPSITNQTILNGGARKAHARMFNAPACTRAANSSLPSQGSPST
jgi:hypothetical protein